MSSLVSIIIPVFNKEKYISETIQSVINQTYTNWEIIAVDDCSTDNSCQIIESFLEKKIFLYKNNENKGANVCRNQAIELSHGEYIIFLDADDVLTSNCLFNRVKQIENTINDFFVFPMGTFYHQIGDSSSLWLPNSIYPLKDFLQHNLPWAITQLIWKKDFLIKLNGFDTSFSRLQDVELHTRALMNENLVFDKKNEIVDCYYRIDEERKNFNEFEFLKRRVLSTNLFINKFFYQAKNKSLHKYLLLTSYKTYVQILLQLKKQTITKNQFIELEKELSLTLNLFDNKTIFLFKLGKFFNLLPFRITGVNWILSKLLVL